MDHITDLDIDSVHAHDDPGDDLYVCPAGHHHCDGPCTLDHDCRAEHPHHRPGCHYDVPAAARAAWHDGTYADRL